ncbi:MAG: hypothetical protein Q4G63_04000 [Bacteroidia bacterium]|nr:hypothetical protein [Bacteroidia bacterium]
MKKIITDLLVLVTIFSFSSCMNRGLEDLPEFSDALISSVSRVEYRYISDEVSPASGQNIVKFVILNHTATVNKEDATVNITAKVPANFPTKEKSKLSNANISVNLNLSTAARIQPVGNAPVLGIPGDWSKPNKYLVTAADGNTKKEWTIIVAPINK